jgi:hypothetical protein
MLHRTSNSDRFLGSGQNPLMVVFEPLGFVKYREFLDHLDNYKFLEKNSVLFSLSAISLIFQFIVSEKTLIGVSLNTLD